MRIRKARPLARAALEFANAANGLRPLARKGYSTVLVFWFGWPTSEVPGLYFSASLVDALRRARNRDFAGRRGKAALALTAASWAILGVIRYRGVTTPAPVLDAGLREQLGPDYAEALNALPETTPTRSGRRSLPLGNTVARRRYVEKTNVVSYGPHGRANLADIWRRRDLPHDGKAPVLLQVPGGAWMIGMRRPQACPLMSHLAARGWVCVSIGYRVSPVHTWPDHIVDVKRALAWVKENIGRYGGDPNFVAITGGSAGGHLSALAALTPNDPKFQPGFEHADTSVTAAVPVYGRYDWFSTEGEGRPDFIGLLEKLVVKRKFATHRHVYLDASPIRELRADAPPFFVLHGRDDSLIPVGEAQEFVEELRAVSKSPVAYAELPHAQHAFDIFSSPGRIAPRRPWPASCPGCTRRTRPIATSPDGGDPHRPDPPRSRSPRPDGGDPHRPDPPRSRSPLATQYRAAAFSSSVSAGSMRSAMSSMSLATSGVVTKPKSR